MRPIRTLGLLSLVLIGTRVSDAQTYQICQQASTSLTTTNWNSLISLNKFDPALGILDSVTIQIAGHAEGSVSTENLDFSPTDTTIVFKTELEVDNPDGTVAALAHPTQAFHDVLGDYDGVLDFGGTSGVTHSGLSVDSIPGTPSTITDVNVLGLYAGPATSPGSMTMTVKGTGQSISFGSGNMVSQFQTRASASVTVCFNYHSRFSSFCSGDGSGTACPCGNNGAAGQGCLNSFGFGSTLAGTGVAIVGADSVVLTANVGTVAPTTFFQGSLQSNLGLGSVFGDGLRCTAGSVIRLQTAFAVAGVATYPHAGDPSVSVRGMVPAVGGTRYYQAWYRQAAAFCTTSTFNLSQGLRVAWGA